MSVTRVVRLAAWVGVLAFAGGVGGCAGSSGGGGGASGQIVFDGHGTGPWDIWIVGSDGSGLRQLTTSASTTQNHEPSFSPDGKKVAFVSSADNATWDVFVVPADGSASSQNLTPSHAWGRASWPRFTPDGRWIIFGATFSSGDADDHSDLLAVRADGSGGGVTVSLTQASYGEFYDVPTVRPGGQQLLYYYSYWDGNTWSESLGYGALQATTSTVTLTPTGTAGTFVWHASFAPNGQALAYETGGFDSDVWVGTWTGAAITGASPLTTTHTDRGPAFSHDGSWIAFQSSRSGSEGLLYVMRADGADQHQIPLDPSVLFVGAPDAY